MVKSVTVPGKCYAISDGDRQDNPISIYCHFLSCFLPPYWVSLSVFCARKLLLLKSLFLDNNYIQIDSIIPHNFCFALCLLHWMGGGGGGGCGGIGSGGGSGGDGGNGGDGHGRGSGVGCKSGEEGSGNGGGGGGFGGVGSRGGSGGDGGNGGGSHGCSSGVGWCGARQCGSKTPNLLPF